MKICKKCKNEYKDEYVFCPKCGKAYEEQKETIKKTKPKSKVNKANTGSENIFWKIWNIILYAFGGFTILGSLLTITDQPASAIFGILFGLSLFKIFYKLAADKLNVDDKILKILRVVLPIVFLIMIGVVTPVDTEEAATTSDKIVCYDETNEKDNDGITSRVNYHVITENIEESVSKYIFENDELAYKYYKNNIKELEENNNEVNLLNNTMMIFNKKELRKEGTSVTVSFYESLGSTCNKEDSEKIKEFNKIKKEFTSQKKKSEKYIKDMKQKEKNEKKKSEVKEKENTKTETKEINKNSDDVYTDALRKCTVMEAADIYTTGVGQKTDNAFNDGRDACNGFVDIFGRSEFIKIVDEDWENRKNEQIDGKPLTHYLDVLGW